MSCCLIKTVSMIQKSITHILHILFIYSVINIGSKVGDNPCDIIS